MCQETASHFPAETFGFGVHNWLLKVCGANFFIYVTQPHDKIIGLMLKKVYTTRIKNLSLFETFPIKCAQTPAVFKLCINLSPSSAGTENSKPPEV